MSKSNKRKIADAVHDISKHIHDVSKREDSPPSQLIDRAPEPILQFFNYEHLPEHLREVSKTFGLLAGWINENLPRNPERTVALRKLLEAKDAAVRARIYKE